MFKLKQRVRMYVQDGPTVEGILAAKNRREYVLWAPRVITADQQKPEVAVSGHVEIPRERVLYYQVIG